MRITYTTKLWFLRRRATKHRRTNCVPDSRRIYIICNNIFCKFACTGRFAHTRSTVACCTMILLLSYNQIYFLHYCGPPTSEVFFCIFWMMFFLRVVLFLLHFFQLNIVILSVCFRFSQKCI